MEPRRQFSNFAQKMVGPYEQNADGFDTGKVTPEYLRFVRPEAYHDDLPEGHNHDGDLDYDHDGDYEIPDTLKDQLKEEAKEQGGEWAEHSEHTKPTYPFEDDDHRELNFPGSIVNDTGSSLDDKLSGMNDTDNRVHTFLRHFPGEVFKNGGGLVKVLTGELERNDRTEHGMYYPDHDANDAPVFEPVYDDADNNGIPDSEEYSSSSSSSECATDDESCEDNSSSESCATDDEECEGGSSSSESASCATDDEECEAAADEDDTETSDDYSYTECESDDEECEAAEEEDEEEDAAADEEEEEAAALAARRNGDIYAKMPIRHHFRPSQHKKPKAELKQLFANKDVKAGNDHDSAPSAAMSHAQLSNQERLYNHIAARPTYPEWDSQSYISPYTQRDHAWFDTQYDMSNETHWVDTSAVDGYKIPITADDADQFAQMSRPMQTYPEWDSESYISPYTQRDHAWNSDQYDMSNETHWVDTSAVDGYKIPITADDADSFVQRTRRTYPEWDS
jgi:hypothetical protein